MTTLSVSPSDAEAEFNVSPVMFVQILCKLIQHTVGVFFLGGPGALTRAY